MQSDLSAASSCSSPAIQLIDLAKIYGRSTAPVHALRGVSLEVGRGERIGLLGKSGSGKSTLLNLLGGLDRPTFGSIHVAGHDLARLGSRRLARFRRSTVGMIFQSFNLIPSRTALQNVALPLLFADRPRRERHTIACRALEAVGLGHRLHHRPTELSGGEQQRVAVARALVNRPAILLADEPTGNLDSATSAEIMALLTEHVRAEGMTLVLVTHDEELARRSTDRIARLRDGQLVSDYEVASAEAPGRSGPEGESLA
jgi:predicted ABC-type transport system involved in lysophospholipase L1 biosynthesis ATPase subunit